MTKAAEVEDVISLFGRGSRSDPAQKVVQHHRLAPEAGDGEELLLQKCTGADEAVDLVIDVIALVKGALHGTDEAFGQRTVDAALFHAGPLAFFAHAGFAELFGVELHHHVVGAEHLHIVHRLHHGHPAFRPGADDRGRQLEIDVVEMDEVRLELPDDLLQLPFCLKRVEDAEGVEQLFRPGVVEVHIGGGEVQGIADGVFFVVHAKIFDLVAPAGQFLADLEEVSLCTAAGVEKFIDE